MTNWIVPSLHLMIDIETLSTAPDAAILSVGACFFAPFALDAASILGSAYYAAVDLRSALADGSIDADTLRWWLRQSEEQRAEAFGGTMPLRRAIEGLVEFVRRREPTWVWAHGPQFDLVILESAMRRLAIEVPWSYRAVRDLRTLEALAGDLVAPLPRTTPFHDALADARHQAMEVATLLRALSSTMHARTGCVDRDVTHG
ncbi:MAG: 3'-5' exoribonuclease [Rhodovulum sp.]|nr:3'-5' exoribonuclease [Rhodovulum sp.]